MQTSRSLARACQALVATTLVLAATHAYAASGHCGRASWYALHSRTASGERMNPAKLTAAHRRLDFGTHIEVENERNGKTVVVRVNDRGPFVHGRVLDLSRAAARRLGFVSSGTAKVCFHIVADAG